MIPRAIDSFCSFFPLINFLSIIASLYPQRDSFTSFMTFFRSLSEAFPECPCTALPSVAFLFYLLLSRNGHSLLSRSPMSLFPPSRPVSPLSALFNRRRHAAPAANEDWEREGSVGRFHYIFPLGARTARFFLYFLRRLIRGNRSWSAEVCACGLLAQAASLEFMNSLQLLDKTFPHCGPSTVVCVLSKLDRYFRYVFFSFLKEKAF